MKERIMDEAITVSQVCRGFVLCNAQHCTRGHQESRRPGSHESGIND